MCQAAARSATWCESASPRRPSWSLRRARHGVTVPRLLIVCALERSDEITSADKRELLVELFTIHRLLGNMANNINQIARAVNSTGDLPEQTGAVMTALWSTMQRVNREIDRFSLS